MLVSKLFCLSAALHASASTALNILVTNDDGFAAANVREFNRLLKASGHNTILVAPVDNESGQGGRAVFTTSRNLTVASEFGIIPAGAPSFGQDPVDKGVWYYNGTPAATTLFALDYVIPMVWGNSTKPDLIAAGPNFGSNLGPFLYTISGTIGATYAGVGRGIPGIAFSAGNSQQRDYRSVNSTVTQAGYPADPATVTAQIAVSLVNQIASTKKANTPLLPNGYGLNVNIPFITSATNASCINPQYFNTRLTGGADIDRVVYNATSGLFTYVNIVPQNGTGVNTCINGDCSLPGETDIAGTGACRSSVSVFTIDYDAPKTAVTTSIQQSLAPVVTYFRGNSRAKRGERSLNARYQKN